MSENIILQNEEENVIVATFNITAENTTIQLSNLTGASQIDWGDGNVNDNLTHMYTLVGEYTCKIFDVTSIGESAFEKNTSLMSIEIPNNVTSIGLTAFLSCSNLTSVVIGDSVTTIGEDAFAYCNSLMSIMVSENNMTYQSMDGNIYSKDGTVLIQYAIGKIATEFIVPDSVISIGDDAFLDCSNLMSVVIPDSVTSIGSYAFYDCDNLTSVVIGDSVTSIGDSAFSSCSSLTSITIPDSVTSIGDSAFNDCSDLTSVIIGSGVTSINRDAFLNCSSLTSITVSGQSTAYESIDGNLYTKDGTTLIQYASGKIAREFIIPGSVTSIGHRAFYNCTSLTSVKIPDSVRSIGHSAFYNCTRLTSVIIPDSVIEIGISVFEACSSLTSAIIPDSVTSIGRQMFFGCSSLTSVVVGEGTNQIESDAFISCNKLTSVTFKGKKPIQVGMLYALTNYNTLTYYVPKDSVEVYRNTWSSIIMPEQIQADPDEDLINLDGLKTYHNTLKEKYLDSMATQDWVNEKLVGKTDYLGTTDTIPNFTAAGAGDYCRVSAEFVYDETTGEMAHVGDILIAIKDNPTQDKADWDLVHTELGAAPATSEDINALFEEA